MLVLASLHLFDRAVLQDWRYQKAAPDLGHRDEMVSWLHYTDHTLLRTGMTASCCVIEHACPREATTHLDIAMGSTINRTLADCDS